MSQKIRHLSQEVISQVAAGEIIERPSSVIKELLENAIDAQATKIAIELEQGGKKSIRVDDNGEGIEKEDLSLALLPHTTSKIASIEDMAHIATFGFRGEALASIAHVSQLTLMSRKNEEGYQISSFGNQAFTVIPCSLRAHTSVRIHELYYNTPARKKFLKTDQTEYGHCLELIKKIALAHPDIGFALTHNHKNIFVYPREDQEKRILHTLGSDFLDHVLAVSEHTQELSIRGYISHPHATQHLRNIHFCFVNQRLVKDKIINSALKEAYKEVMHLDHDMSYVLFLDVHTDFVDVNVHPTKSEVRFQNPALVYQFIKHMAQTSLSSKPTLASIHHHTHLEPTQNAPHTVSAQQDQLSFTRPSVQKPDSHHIVGPLALDSSPSNARTSDHQNPQPYPKTTKVNNHLLVHSKQTEAQSPARTTPIADTILPEDNAVESILGYALAQLHGIYILAENQTGLIIVDMHAAHERILYEKYKTAFANKNIEQQMLISPIMIPLSIKEEESLQEHQQLLLDLGFEFSLIGHQKLAIRAIPALLIRYDIEKILSHIIQELLEYEHSAYTDRLFHSILSRIACHRAFRAHDTMSLTQMNQLLRELENTQRGGQCNHGRPTYFHISLDKIDKLFMRGE